MASIFDYFEQDQIEFAENAGGRDVVNAPVFQGLKQIEKRIQDMHHEKTTQPRLLSATVKFKDKKKMEKKLGKSFVNAPISILITNDAKRYSSSNEKARGFGDFVYYGKFIEYGYMSMGGKPIPGKRIFESNINEIQDKVTQALKKTNMFSRESVIESMIYAGNQIGHLLSASSPVSAKRDPRLAGLLRFADAWQAKVYDAATKKNYPAY